MLTPFTKAGDVSENELRRLVDFLIGAGVDGLFPLGSAGESVHLSREEKVRAMGIIVDQARGRVPVTPGVGSTHPKESIFLANTAKEMGCAGVVVAPPYYYPLSQEMIEKYYEAIIEAVDLPLSSTILLFLRATRLRCGEAAFPSQECCGHEKESSGSMVDLVHFMDKVKQIGEDIHFLTGREETLFPCLMMGAKGCMAATACVLPEVMVGIYRAWQKGDYDEARRLQFSIPLLVRAMFALPFPLGFKGALETRGFDMGPPIQPLSDAERFKYRTVKARIEKVIAPLLDSLNNQSRAAGATR